MKLRYLFLGLFLGFLALMGFTAKSEGLGIFFLILALMSIGYAMTSTTRESILHEDEDKLKRKQRTKTVILWTLGIISLGVLGGFLDAGLTKSGELRPAVQASPWDGSVYQVKDWLKENLKDPKSIEYIKWTPLIHMDDGTYTIGVKYRAKNSFGGYVIEERIFTLNNEGKVISSVEY